MKYKYDVQEIHRPIEKVMGTGVRPELIDE